MRNVLLFLALMIMLSACGENKAPPVLPSLPESLGGLRLAATVQGVKANKFMYRMHGRLTGARGSIIGYYGPGEKKNALYVSGFENPQQAKKALVKMMSKIVAST